MNNSNLSALPEALRAAGITLILASGSPRRRQLIEGLDMPVKTESFDAVDEIVPPDLSAFETPAYLARLKSDAFRPLAANEVLITADTVVVCDGRLLGKPTDREDARAMLQRLSGNRHEVLTGVCLRTVAAVRTFTEQTTVVFRPLEAAEIDFYLDRYRPCDKAGAYGAQEWMGFVGIERIEGSYFNVMGLPLHRLYEELKALIIDFETFRR
ncbi:MAG: Maf family nucleotide pyrophosphatase [Prevotellaceae bacterium]|jgi:septum formation protein|nr:Maf family nucleotide pyrophosphatase [Prevotellaceae bacterium]